MALDSLFLLLKNLVLFSSFVSEKSSFPKPLSKQKEREYVIAAEAGDREAHQTQSASCRAHRQEVRQLRRR